MQNSPIQFKWFEAFQFAQIMEVNTKRVTRLKSRSRRRMQLLVSFNIPDIQIEPFALKLCNITHQVSVYSTSAIAIALGHRCAHKSDPLSLCTTHYIYYYCQYMWNDIIGTAVTVVLKDTSPSGAFELNTLHFRINYNYIHSKLRNEHAKHILMLSLAIYRHFISLLHERTSTRSRSLAFWLSDVCTTGISTWFVYGTVDK